MLIIFYYSAYPEEARGEELKDFLRREVIFRLFLTSLVFTAPASAFMGAFSITSPEYDYVSPLLIGAINGRD